MELPERKIYTVSELTEEIKNILEGQYPSVWIQGEVSNFKHAPSGHFYFTLSDETAQIRCVMFKTQNRFLKFRPEDGLRIVAWGRLSVYLPRGEYQLILDTMEPLGIGSLMLAFEQLKEKLAREGLFDEGRKRPIPRFPRTIGLVTSPKGAAVRDMIRIAHRRFPGINILVSPTSVQGDKAPAEIVAALERISRTDDVDVILMGRGGGAVEDLWAFNDERVVRAVAACPIPVVSAVGHETDFTLTDFAADLRASTPSAAAELVVPDRRELLDRATQLMARLRSSMTRSLDRTSNVVAEVVKRLYDPRRAIDERRQRLDEAVGRLVGMMRRTLNSRRVEFERTAARLRPELLRRPLAAARTEWEALTLRLSRSTRSELDRARSSVESLASKLESLSPLAVLARGYSVTLRPETGAVLRDAAAVEVGDEVSVRLQRGELKCQVKAKKENA
jgi:exodeoxyribonuclease VII large subunit